MVIARMRQLFYTKCGRFGIDKLSSHIEGSFFLYGEDLIIGADMIFTSRRCINGSRTYVEFSA
jgi:hypothetical protein